MESSRNFWKIPSNSQQLLEELEKTRMKKVDILEEDTKNAIKRYRLKEISIKSQQQSDPTVESYDSDDTQGFLESRLYSKSSKIALALPTSRKKSTESVQRHYKNGVKFPPIMYSPKTDRFLESVLAKKSERKANKNKEASVLKSIRENNFKSITQISKMKPDEL